MTLDSHDRASTTPKPRVLKKSTPNTQNMKQQRSILGFFQPKSSPTTPKSSQAASTNAQEPESSPAAAIVNRKPHSGTPTTSKAKYWGGKNDSASSLTPAPSSDMVEPEEDNQHTPARVAEKGSAGNMEAGLPSPATSANGRLGEQAVAKAERGSTTPSRRVRVRDCF